MSFNEETPNLDQLEDYNDILKIKAFKEPQCIREESSEEGEIISEEEGEINSENEPNIKEIGIKEKTESVCVNKSDLEEGEISEDEVNIIQPKKIIQKEKDLNFNFFNKVSCKFYIKGTCSFGSNCRFIHSDKDFVKRETQFQEKFNMRPVMPINYAELHYQQPFQNERILDKPFQEKKIESAWERGLRQAKELMRKTQSRKNRAEDNFDSNYKIAYESDEFHSRPQDEIFHRNFYNRDYDFPFHNKRQQFDDFLGYDYDHPRNFDRRNDIEESWLRRIKMSRNRSLSRSLSISRSSSYSSSSSTGTSHTSESGSRSRSIRSSPSVKRNARGTIRTSKCLNNSFKNRRNKFSDAPKSPQSPHKREFRDKERNKFNSKENVLSTTNLPDSLLSSLNHQKIKTISPSHLQDVSRSNSPADKLYKRTCIKPSKRLSSGLSSVSSVSSIESAIKKTRSQSSSTKSIRVHVSPVYKRAKKCAFPRSPTPPHQRKLVTQNNQKLSLSNETSSKTHKPIKMTLPKNKNTKPIAVNQHSLLLEDEGDESPPPPPPPLYPIDNNKRSKTISSNSKQNKSKKTVKKPNQNNSASALIKSKVSCRRQELMMQLRAVEEAIAKKRKGN